MTIDFWGLGLQAVNVLILVWLLSQVFWRPVAAAIAKRQEAAQAVTEAAKITQAKADKALAEAAQARAGMAEERTALLDAAKAESESATKAALGEARTRADAIVAAARDAVRKDADAARKANEGAASELSLTIAARLLHRMVSPAIQSVFLTQLIDAIADMPASDRAALVADPEGIEIVSADDPGTEGDAAQGEITLAVQTALGGSPDIRFSRDPGLIAGLDLRSPHLVVHNSWQADLAQVRKAVNDAA